MRKGIHAIIMAAGSSRRMGQNKLLMKIHGEEVINLFLKNVPYKEFEKIVFVYADEEVSTLCGYHPWLTPLKSIKGNEKSKTIQLGTKECEDAAGIMYLVADQPFIKKETITAILDKFNEDRSRIVIPFCNNKPRNPVIFPQSTIPELLKVTGDRGGRDVMDKYPELKMFLVFDEEEQFIDIDTRADYEKSLKILR